MGPLQAATPGPTQVDTATQSDGAVDASAFAGDLVVGVLNGDLVAQESRRACAGVGDERLGLRQFQVEFVTQERRDTVLDVLGLGFRPGEPEEMVIAVPHVTQSPEPQIGGVLARYQPHLAAQRGGKHSLSVSQLRFRW